MNHLVVIPTYNEQENIEKLVPKIFELLPSVSILVVDDNSPDKTWETVQRLTNQYPNLQLLRRAKKEGLGKAYIDAFRVVLAQNKYDTITTMDADFSHDPNTLPETLKKAEIFGLVVGSRYTQGGGISKKWKWYRKLLSRGSNLYTSLFLGFAVKDWTSGFNTIQTKYLADINLNQLETRGYAFVISLKYLVIKAGASVIETPIFFEDRLYGISKMTASVIFANASAVWRIKFRKII